MAHYPQSATGLNYITYPTALTSELSITAPGSNNTKGAFTEVIDTSPFACNRMLVTTSFTTNVSRQILFDIATGPGGSESVVIPNLLAEGTEPSGASTFCAGTYDIPIAISAGTRISCRYQINNITSAGLLVAFTLFAAGDTPGIASFTALGADTSDSGGTQVDPGAVANTKGSYVELEDSTAAVYQFLLVQATLKGNTASASARWPLDIATGAGGGESVLVPNLRFVNGTSTNLITPRSIPILTYIAASTRIAVRASCSSTDGTDRLIDVAILAGTAPAESSGGGESSHVFVG